MSKLSRVEILRDVVTKLTPMIAGKGMIVTQIGTQAFCEWGLDGRPKRINIPYIAHDADENFCRAIQGFIDHEVAHALFTDYSVPPAASQRGAEKAIEFGHDPKVGAKRLHSLANIVEDTFIEREMCKRFKGTGYNLDQLYDIFLNRITGPALADARKNGDEKQEFNVLLVPIIRAWAGQTEFKRFLDGVGAWEQTYVKALVDGCPQRVIDRIPTLKDSFECLEVAEELYNILYPKKKEEEELPPAEGDESGEEDSDCSGDGEPSSAKGKGSKKGKGDGKKGKKAKKDKADDKAADDAKGDKSDTDDDRDGEERVASDKKKPEKADDRDDRKDAGKDDDKDPADDAEETAKAGDEEKDEEEDGAAADDGGDDASSGAGDADDTPEKADGGEKEDNEKGELIEVEAVSVTPSPFDDFEPDSSGDIATVIATLIGDEALREMRGLPYSILTRDWDRIRPPEGTVYSSQVEAMESDVRHMIGPMQKAIERAMAARSQAIKVPGFRSGKLHGGSLHRLSVNDDRVFRRIHINRTKETAVTLLIDNSGSMGGPKIDTAQKAGFALSQTLERVGVKHEVLGFTSHSLETREQIETVKVEEERLGKHFDRAEIIEMPLYKGFDERINPEIKKRFVMGYNGSVRLDGNVDGESVRYAGQRLLRRPEPRKVMLVLSDGSPAGNNGRAISAGKLNSDLHAAIKELEKAGVDVVGIGVLTDIVKTFYKKNIHLRNLGELPKVVMGELQRILTAA